MGNIGGGGSYFSPKYPNQQAPKKDLPLNAPYETNVTNGLSLPGSLDNLAAAIALTLLAGGDISPELAKALGMSPLQFSQLLKQLLQLPNNFQQFLAELVTQKQGGEALETLAQFLKENPQLPLSLENLQGLLQESLDKNQQKLKQILLGSPVAQTVQGNAGGAKNGLSAGDMLSLLSDLSRKVSTSPTQALNTTLLLYLPWYPLAGQQKLNLQFQQPSKADGDQGDENSDEIASAGSEAHLIVLLDTNTLGRFKMTILPIQPTQLMFHIEHDTVAQGISETLQTGINTFLSENGFMKPEYAFKPRKIPSHRANQPFEQAKVDTTTSSASSAQDSAERENRQAIALHSIGTVSYMVVQCAYQLAKTLFELDNQRINPESTTP